MTDLTATRTESTADAGCSTEMPDGVILRSIFNGQVPCTRFSDQELKALALAMNSISNTGASALSGYTYLGQFLAHDLTLLRFKNPAKFLKSSNRSNFLGEVTAELDLSSVYSEAIPSSPTRVGARMALDPVERLDGSLLEGYDLPRADLYAQMGDRRNDENLIVAQLHVQFLRLHNFFVCRIESEQPSLDEATLFEAAKRQVILHYQEVILYDYLYEILDPAVWRAIILEDRNVLWERNPGEEAVVPLEFSVAAARFGHSMVRDRYLLNRNPSVGIEDLFRMTGAGRLEIAVKRLSVSYVVDWLLFFDFPSVKRDPRQRRNESRRISPRVKVVLKHTGQLHRPEMINLAHRNLVSGNLAGLCSGQDAVRYVLANHAKQLRECSIELATLTHEQLNLNEPINRRDLLARHCPSLLGRTPLWYYLLAEAYTSKRHEGIGKLGPLGSLIVAESIKGLLKTDGRSTFFSVDRRNDIVPTKLIDGANSWPVLQMSDLILAANPKLPDPADL